MNIQQYMYTRMHLQTELFLQPLHPHLKYHVCFSDHLVGATTRGEEETVEDPGRKFSISTI